MGNISSLFNAKNTDSSELREVLKMLNESFSNYSSQESLDFAEIKNSLTPLSVTLKRALVLSSKQTIADFTLAVRELASYLSDDIFTSSTDITSVINYIQQHEDLLDDYESMSIDEALGKIDKFYQMPNTIYLSEKQLSMLNSLATLMDTLQINQNKEPIILVCLITLLLTIFQKENS